MLKTLKDWFCLKDNRQNFKPNVRSDRALIFCHEDEIEKRAQMSIEKSFAIGEPVKMMIYGNWGVGKTHAVQHICWWLEHHPDFAAKTVFVEVGDINKKSRFDVLVRPFLDEIGIEEIVRLVNSYAVKAGKNIRQGLREIGIGADVVEDYATFMMSPPGSSPVAATEQAFEHLKGGTIKSGGVASKLEQSREFFDVLAALGHIYKAVDERNLIFIADEAARLDDLEADETSVSHWEAVNRLIFDDDNDFFGFVYTFGAANERNVPRVLTHPQTMNRLGKQNFIFLENLSATETERFVGRLVNEFVDKPAVDKLAGEGTLGADYDPEVYPFTKSGYARFIDHWKRNSEDAKPRDITDSMTDAAFIAMKKDKRLIDDEALESAGM